MGQRVAIVGAGIVGVSTAIWAQREGHQVVLIDRKGPAAGASFGNGGVLAASSVMPVTGPGLRAKAPGMLLSRRQPLFMRWGYAPQLLPFLMRYLSRANAASATARATAMLPIIGDSLADHQALARGTAATRWIEPSDYLYLYPNRRAYEADRFGWETRRALGLTWEELEGLALRVYDPNFAPELRFAAKFGHHGRITDPGGYVRDLAASIEENGGHVVQAEATDIVHEAGAVTGLRVGGETLPCDVVVIATGAWSKPLARKLGVRLPLESERGYHLDLWEPSIVPRAPVMVTAGKFVITPMAGRLRVAGVVEFGGLKAGPSKAPFRLLEAGLRAAMPDLRWKKTEKWMGHRPALADSIPVISDVPGIKGAYLGLGHDHVGLTGGPKTGRLLAQMMSGKKPNIDMSPYEAARFMRTDKQAR